MGRKGWGKKGVCVHFPIHVLKRKYINLWSGCCVIHAITGAESQKLNLLSQCWLKETKPKGNSSEQESTYCFGFASVEQNALPSSAVISTLKSPGTFASSLAAGIGGIIFHKTRLWFCIESGTLLKMLGCKQDFSVCVLRRKRFCTWSTDGRGGTRNEHPWFEPSPGDQLWVASGEPWLPTSDNRCLNQPGAGFIQQ